MKIISVLIFIVLYSINVSYGQRVELISYNIRYDNPDDGENRWDLRKSFLTNQLKFYEPDILGIQEGLFNQVSYLDSSLANYNWVGVGRDDGEKGGEFCAIFYNTQTFSLIKQSTFWLSETPDAISIGWDAALERICTAALFENIQTKQRVWIFNTHFDHQGEMARKNSAKLIMKKIDTLNQNKYPIILMGDLNLEPDSETIQYLSEQLNDSKYASTVVTFGNEGTFNDFNFKEPVIKRIDYIFTGKKGIEVLKYAVLSDSKNCRYPSDHLAVYVEIGISKGN